MPYRFQPLSPNTPQEHLIAAINRNFAEIDNESVTKIYLDSSGDRHILIGRGQNGFNGIKIAKSGYDVYTATDDQLIFNSDQNVFKIVETGTISVPAYNGGDPGVGNYGRNAGDVITQAHSLGYAPAYFAFIEISGFHLPFPHTAYYTPSATEAFWYTYKMYVDDTDIHVSIDLLSFGSSLGIGAFDLRYYLLQETAS